MTDTEIMDEVCTSILTDALKQRHSAHPLRVCPRRSSSSSSNRSSTNNKQCNKQAEALRFASETSWDVWVKNEEIRKLLTQIRTATVRATKDESLSQAPFLKHFMLGVFFFRHVENCC